MTAVARGAVDMLEAAWELAAAAWEVFPCKWTGPHAKAPMTVNGHLNATMDPDQIKLWWTKWPNAMIGAKVPDNYLVLDIDPRNDGSIEPRGVHRPPARNAHSLEWAQRRWSSSVFPTPRRSFE
jgi:hypothetical protein